MSWLSENNPFGDGGSSTATGSDPNTWTPQYWNAIRPNTAYYNQVKQYDPVYKAEQQANQDAANATATANATGVATNTNPVVKGPTQSESAAAALQKLLGAFGGSEGGASLVPSTLDDPAIAGIFGAQKGKAQDYIGNLLKRGVITPSGQTSGLTALGTQEPGVRTKLNDVGNLLLEQERGKVRGIYNEGAQAAGGVAAGADFDPTPYATRATSNVSDFSGRLSDAIASQVGGDLFDTSGLASSTGSPSSGQTNLDLDPYAASGGKLTTGLDSGAGAAPAKRRSTAVF